LKIKILLVDDHDLVRTGLKSILEVNQEIEVIAEKSSGEDALEFLQQADPMPDVVLMDVNMPGIGGIEATRRIHSKYPDINVIAVTALQEAPFPSQLFKAGATGYVSKGCDAGEMFKAIQSVRSGKQFLAEEVAKQADDNGLKEASDSNPFATLSDREMQIMMMVTQGQSNQSICDSLFLSPKTISTYRHRIYDKLDIHNDVELTRLAIRYGIISE
jgi:two-component system, NarL family, invasion response regulator UvrY